MHIRRQNESTRGKVPNASVDHIRSPHVPAKVLEIAPAQGRSPDPAAAEPELRRGRAKIRAAKTPNELPVVALMLKGFARLDRYQRRARSRNNLALRLLQTLIG
jgi:hypothetical protein